jgi:hypothetical protein
VGVGVVVATAREGEVGLAGADEAVHVAVAFVVVREAKPEKVEGERADARLLTHNAHAAHVKGRRLRPAASGAPEASLGGLL